MKKSEKNPVTVDFGMAPEQLSYICEYCGKVNPIAAEKCLRCGKRRPRSEYIKVMEKAKQQEASLHEKVAGEMEKIAQTQKDEDEKKLVRLVEERVADEKALIQKQQNTLREQEIDQVRRMTAREAALRVLEAEKRADEAIAGKARETEEMLRNEREKVLYAAAQKVVSERAGIEQAAEERINLARAELEKQSNRTIASAVDIAEKDAARRAAMKVIASEQACEDKIRLEREASQRMAFEKIKEEADRVSKYEEAKYQAQLEGVHRAVEERIRAEREYMEEQLGAVGSGQFPPAPVMPYGMPAPLYQTQQPTTVQPLAIVPYLNDKQPVNQYDPEKYQRKLYKFIPDEVQPEDMPEKTEEEWKEPKTVAPAKAKPVPQKKKTVLSRIIAILSLLVTAGMVFHTFFKTPESGTSSYFTRIVEAPGVLAQPEGITVAILGLLCVVYVILTLIWLFKGSGVKAGWVVPVLKFVDIIAMLVLIGSQYINTIFMIHDGIYLLAMTALLFIFALVEYISCRRDSIE